MLKQLQKLSPSLQKIIGNIGWLSLEKLVTMFLSLAIGIYVIRYLGASNFGLLGYAVSFVELFGAVARLGFEPIVVRNLVAREEAKGSLLGTAAVLKFLASLLTIALIFIFSHRFHYSAQILKLTTIISATLIFTTFDVIDFWFHSQVMSKSIALVRSSQLILSYGAKLLFIAWQLPLMAFVWLILGESIFKATASILVYYCHRESIWQWRFNWFLGKELLRDSYPLIFSSLMVTIYMKIDQVMLGNMIGNEAVGNYAAAIRFSEIWYFIPVAICASVFPSIVRTRDRSHVEYYQKLQQLYDLMAWLSVGIALPMTILARPLMTLLLDGQYNSAGDILAVHIWASPFVFLGVARSQWLIAENLAKFNFATTSIGAITNVILNLLLIPHMGGLGAALATLISYGVASHLTCLFYPRMFRTGWMLTKALFIPFRLRQNLLYLSYVKKVFT